MANCTGCGNCCSSLLPVSKQEITAIKKFVKANKIKQKISPIGAMVCPFLDTSKSKNKCMIYPSRPWICRIFNCEEIKVNTADLKTARTAINMQEIDWGM